MADLTYTCKLENFDETNREITINLMIPLQDNNNKYVFENNIDLSKFQLFKKNINAIFIHLKKEHDNGDRLSETIYNHVLKINVDDLENHVTDIDRKFDFEIKECLVLVFHDKDFHYSDVNYLFGEIEKIYDEANNNGNFSTGIPPKTLIPRRLGVSIIKP